MPDNRPAATPLRLHWRLLLGALARLPSGALSRITGRIADLPLPRALRTPLFRGFAGSARIDLSEVEKPLREYPTFDAFFVRGLKPGARAWPREPSVIGSPVDGIIGQFGRIENGRLLQVKGRAYTAASLLAGDDAARFDHGSFLTLYLSPRHYHRVHSPLSGLVIKARHVPGVLLPVNRPAIESVDLLFPRNERLITLLDSEAGMMAAVAVGAFNVGRITASYDDRLVTNRSRAAGLMTTYEPGIRVQRGDEIAVFHLGSTVVLLFEAGRIRFRDSLATFDEIRLGEPVAERLR